MEELSTYSETELLHLINKCKNKHDDIKIKINDLLDTIEKIGKDINEFESELDKSEMEYVKLVEEYMNRKNVVQ